MSSRGNDRALTRKQRLQEKQRRQLAVVDAVDKVEVKLRKVEEEMAEAVAEAVEVFGGENAASEELGMSIATIRRYLRLAAGEDAVDGGTADGGIGDGITETATGDSGAGDGSGRHVPSATDDEGPAAGSSTSDADIEDTAA